MKIFHFSIIISKSGIAYHKFLVSHIKFKYNNIKIVFAERETIVIKSPLDVYSDLSEQLHFNIPNLQLYVQKDYLSRYGYAVACCQHPDLEFILVLDGIMDF